MGVHKNEKRLMCSRAEENLQHFAIVL
jgi:hypothetical protein